jgi:hypothetical protein
MEKMIIRLMDLPCGVKGYVREDSDGNYNVYLNAKFDGATRAKVLLHEIEHILRDDFRNELNISEIEDI